MFNFQVLPYLAYMKVLDISQTAFPNFVFSCIWVVKDCIYLNTFFFFFPSCKAQLKRKHAVYTVKSCFTSCLYKAQIASDTELLWLRRPMHCIYFNLQCLRWFSRKYFWETHLQWNPFNYRTFVSWDLISDVLPAIGCKFYTNVSLEHLVT